MKVKVEGGGEFGGHGGGRIVRTGIKTRTKARLGGGRRRGRVMTDSQVSVPVHPKSARESLFRENEGEEGSDIANRMFRLHHNLGLT